MNLLHSVIHQRYCALIEVRKNRLSCGIGVAKRSFAFDPMPRCGGARRRAEANAPFSFGSAFSGAGGAVLAYGLAGGHPLFAIEIDPEAARPRLHA
jgi:hypothetical protein